MSELSSLLAQEASRFNRSTFNTGINAKDRCLDVEYAERLLRMNAGASRRDAGMIEHEGRMCPVLWRRGGKVHIEIAEGIRKEVVE